MLRSGHFTRWKWPRQQWGNPDIDADFDDEFDDVRFLARQAQDSGYIEIEFGIDAVCGVSAHG